MEFGIDIDNCMFRNTICSRVKKNNVNPHSNDVIHHTASWSEMCIKMGTICQSSVLESSYWWITWQIWEMGGDNYIIGELGRSYGGMDSWEGMDTVL